MTINGRSVAVIFALTFIGFSTVPAAVHAGSAGVADPEKWYAESYGPLWHDNAWDKVDEILFYYDSEVWDHYSNREDDYSCAWYLADVIDGKWKFTHFAAIDCQAHGF